MKILTSNEIFPSILELVKHGKEDIRIASAWIKGDFFRKIIDEIKAKGNINIEVIIRASEINDMNITDESVFKLIKSVNGKLYISNRLHAKFIVVDRLKAVVGSANFTTAGLSDIEKGNIEAASLYEEDQEKEEVQKLWNYFEEIKSMYAFELKENLIGFTLNPVKTTSFEFITINPDIEEQSYVEVEFGDGTVLGKITSIYAYDIGFFANPFSNSQSVLFAPFEDFRKIFSGNKHQDWKKVATFAYTAQNDGVVRIAVCEVVGQIKDGKVETLRKPFDVRSPVYIASQDKLIEVMKTNFNNQKMKTPVAVGKVEGTDIDVYIDLEEVVSKHMFITGTTGSGKSFFTKKFLCNVLEQDKCIEIFIFDPHGEYYEKLKNCIDEKFILHIEFEDAIIPTDPDEIMEIIEQAGFGKLTNKNTNLGKELFSRLSRYIKPSLRITGLKEKSILDIIKEVNFEEQDKSKNKQKNPTEENADQVERYDIKDELIKTLIEIYGETTLNSQPKQLRDIGELEGKRLYIYNLKKVTDPNSRVNLAGLILQEIFNKNKQDYRRRLVVLEEAHNFAPERGYGDVSSGKDNISLVMARKIASEGRKFNLGLVVISQRPAQISKYILSQLNTQVLFRIINSSDLEAIKNYVEYVGADALNLLPRFTTGMCMVGGIGVSMPVVVRV